MSRMLRECDRGRIVLVDSENLASASVKCAEELTRRDELVVFYTEKSARVSLADVETLLRCDAKVELVECANGTRNALDFILSTYLGAIASRASAQSKLVLILSNDRGFNNVAKFWRHRGVDVWRQDWDGKRASKDDASS